MKALAAWHKHVRIYLLLVLVASTLAAGGTWLAQNALAATCTTTTLIAYGRDCWRGYFNNGFDDGSNPAGLAVLSGSPAVPWSLSNSDPNVAQDFINFITNYLNSGSNQNKTGAEFIVESMLGYNGGSHPRSCALPGNQCYNDWVTLIKEYDAAKLVDWSHNSPFPCGTENTYYQVKTNDDAFFYDGDDGCGSTVPSIVFYNASKTQIQYTIKRICANPLGKVQGLPKLNYHLTASLSPGTGTPAFTSGPGTGIVQPGVTYHLTPKVNDPTNVSADALYMEVENLNPNWSLSTGISAPGGQDTRAQYRSPATPQKCQSGVAECWHWDYGKGLKANSTSQQTDGASFTVSPSAPQGSLICYKLQIKPSDQNGATLNLPPSGSYCFLVYSPVYPSVVGTSGDVHAGGGLCGGTSSPASSGTITGNPSAVSRGQYVTSASAAVNNFGSNNSASGGAGNTLTLGSGATHGLYAVVCRPDLYNQEAEPAILSGIGYCTIVSTLDLSNLPPGCTLFVSNGGTIDVKESGGPLSTKVTIVARNGGNVVIDNNIIVSATGVDRNNVPSLGIIADGNISIHSAATTVDAYLFADGNIDTCLEATDPLTRNQCFTSTLTINGFVMGYTLEFRRLGPLNASPGSYVSENVALNAGIYLNPPQFFDGSVDVPLLNGQGERQPLF